MAKHADNRHIDDGGSLTERVGLLTAENAILKKLIVDLQSQVDTAVNTVTGQVKDSKQKRPPPLPELLVELIEVWGGAKQIAQCMKDTYESAAPGIKAGVMKTILRLIDLNTQQGGAMEDLIDMTDEEIRAELSKSLKMVI